MLKAWNRHCKLTVLVLCAWYIPQTRLWVAWHIATTCSCRARVLSYDSSWTVILETHHAGDVFQRWVGHSGHPKGPSNLKLTAKLYKNYISGKWGMTHLWRHSYIRRELKGKGEELEILFPHYLKSGFIYSYRHAYYHSRSYGVDEDMPISISFEYRTHVRRYIC